MERFRLMLWGAGFFAKKWLEVIAAREDVEVVGIVSRTPERVEELRREFGLTGLRQYPHWEEAAEKGVADGVLITLPQMLHPESTLCALQAGLHVLVEKPLALDMAGARAVYEGTLAHPGRVVMVNQNYRWRPHVQALRQGILAGRIGRVGHIMIECRQQIRRKTVGGWREQMAEPYLIDFAIHHFDMMRYLTGDEPVRVAAQSFRPAWSWLEGRTAAAAIVTLRGGAVVGYGGTMVSQGLETPQEGLVTVIGEQGTLCLDGKSQVVLLGRGDSEIVPQEAIPGGELGYTLAEFLGAVREKRRPETCVVEHIRSLALALAAVESSNRSSAVDPGELTGFMKQEGGCGSGS
jgi:predicted dehydrogenase